MSKNNYTDITDSYLSRLSDYKLLTKDQEFYLFQNIENQELRFIHIILDYKILIDFIKKDQKKVSNKNFIIKFSKKVNSDSSKAEFKKYTKLIGLFIKSLDWYFNHKTPERKQVVLNLFNKVCPTTSMMFKYIQHIKDIYNDYNELYERKNINYRLLEVSTDEEYELLCHEYLFNKKSLAKRLQLKEEILEKIIRDQESMRDPLKEMSIKVRDINSLINIISDIKNIENNINKSRNELINSNLRLVVSRVKRFLHKGLDFEDLIQEGNIGLIKAIEKFDYKKGYRFSTYATWWITLGIRRGITNKSNIIRIPSNILEFLIKVDTSHTYLLSKLGRTPTVEELCKDTKLKESQVLSVVNLVAQPISIESSVTEDDFQIKDLIPNPDSFDDVYKDPFLRVVHETRRVEIRKMLKQLSILEEKVIRLRYGIGEKHECTHEEIAKQVGMTRQRMHQIESLSLSKLKKSIKHKKSEV